MYLLYYATMPSTGKTIKKEKMVSDNTVTNYLFDCSKLLLCLPELDISYRSVDIHFHAVCLYFD